MIIESDTFKNEILNISDNKDIIIEENPFSKYLVYIHNEKVIGFCYYYEIYDKLEIAYIYVIPKYRKRKIASSLIQYLIDNNKDKYNITLEVREDNESAITLYKKFNFKRVALREKYYGEVDGILMELRI